jgi:ribosomal-protein-alanine N-acetyltransferase
MIEVARSAGCQIIYLEVRPSNVGARHLYRTVGFQQIAIRPEYYPAMHGREDALFLGLTL